MGVDIFSGSSPGRHIYTNRCAWSLEIVRRHARVMEIDNGTFEWLDGDRIWLPRRAVEGAFDVIGSFDARKAHL